MQVRDVRKKKYGSRRGGGARPVKEKSAEKAFIDKMRTYRPESQWWKQNGRGHAARPDRMGLLAAGLQCFIEFKRLSLFPTPAQQRELDDLEQLNHRVACCDTVSQATRFVQDVECGTCVPWRTRWDNDHGV